LATTLTEFFARGADVQVAFRMISEVGARERPIPPLRLAEHPHVRLDPAFIDQPTEHLGRHITGFGTQVRRGDVKPIGSTVDHRFGGGYLRLAHGCRRLDVHDHGMPTVDEIIIRIGVDRGAVRAADPSGRIAFGWSTSIAIAAFRLMFFNPRNGVNCRSFATA
jgi:hypothetical protein